MGSFRATFYHEANIWWRKQNLRATHPIKLQDGVHMKRAPNMCKRHVCDTYAKKSTPTTDSIQRRRVRLDMKHQKHCSNMHRSSMDRTTGQHSAILVRTYTMSTRNDKGTYHAIFVYVYMYGVLRWEDRNSIKVRCLPTRSSESECTAVRIEKKQAHSHSRLRRVRGAHARRRS